VFGFIVALSVGAFRWLMKDELGDLHTDWHQPSISNNEAERRLPDEQSLQTADDTTTRPKPGDLVRLTNSTQTIVLVPNYQDWDRLQQLANAKDEAGVRQFITSGRAFLARDGAAAMLINSGVLMNEVRIVDGPGAGRSGWLPREFVKKSE
jgi:hypothetical protein